MGHQDTTYVIFDADKDMWAYGYMLGWKANKNIPFDFRNAHDLKPLREDAFLEATIKKRLRERFEVTNQVIVLIGDSTKNLFRFVRWEIETALDLDLPIIAVNLNNKRQMDPDRCPPLLCDKPVVHVAFRARVIKYALDNFPSEYRRRPSNWEGNGFYYDETYRSLGITD